MSFKKTAAIVTGAGALSYGAYKLLAEEMFKRSFRKRKITDHEQDQYSIWYSSCKVDEISLESFDGLKLYGYDIHNHDSDEYVIMVHGIWTNSTYMYERACQFDLMGYNVLLVDQRAAGKSEGKYYTYGFKESLDLIQWIDYLVRKYPNAKICLYGISMGADTVMMATRNSLPSNVRCIVEDCGFSSVEEQFDHVLKKDYNLAVTKVALKLLKSQIKENFGIDYKDLSAKKCLQDNEIPILFIHGKDDYFVPFVMAKKLYNNNKGVKKYYAVNGAGHGQANIDVNYYTNIDRFIREYFA